MTSGHSSKTTLLANIRLPDGRMADMAIVDGLVADIAAPHALKIDGAEQIDAAGMLVLPGLVDGHMHIDKTLTGLPWMPHMAGPERLSRIETEKRLRADLPPVAERAADLVRRCIAAGTTALRSHVDIDPEIVLDHLHALMQVRERFADCIDMQFVAFPQSGVLRTPGTAELLEAALLEGAELLGGLDPILIDGDLDGQLDILFAIAERRDVGIDIHLHDTGAHGLAEINALCRRASAAGLAGRITVSHGFCLGAADDAEFESAADAMADAGVSLVTHGGGASPLPPVKRLREHGVVVFAGNDDIRDPWSPFGNGDMLERAMLLAWRSGYRPDDDLALAFDCASSAGAEVLGLEGFGLDVGCRADFFTIEAECLAEAVAQRGCRISVLKAGRVVARDGAFLGGF